MSSSPAFDETKQTVINFRLQLLNKTTKIVQFNSLFLIFNQLAG